MTKLNQAPKLPTLREVLSRVHLRITLVAVAFAGLTVLIAGSAVIRAYTLHNLALIGQSASFTVEAAVVFDDRTAVQEALTRVVASEEIAGIGVVNDKGDHLWDWQRPIDGAGHRLKNWANILLFPNPVRTPIVQGDRVIGEVRLWGDATGLIRFVLMGLGSALLCMLLTAIATSLLAQRLQKTIVEPLQRLTNVAHSVRLDRAFNRRAQPSPIAELTELADDFNALLAELEAWQDSLRSENESLTHLATHDSLTGLPNRAHFEDQLRLAIRHAKTTGGEVAILFLDNDRFKEINDRFGHAAGDAALIEVAQRIRGQLREGDIVARMGGDEFAVLLALRGSADEAGKVAERITASMTRPILLPGGASVTASLSIGMACFPEPCGDEVTLLRVADAAMYEGKRAGRVVDGGAVVPFRAKGGFGHGTDR